MITIEVRARTPELRARIVSRIREAGEKKGIPYLIPWTFDNDKVLSARYGAQFEIDEPCEHLDYPHKRSPEFKAIYNIVKSVMWRESIFDGYMLTN